MTAPASGRDALTGLLDRTFPGQEAFRVTFPVGAVPGLSMCSVYRANDHWLYVTYGLTELRAKESPVSDWSGWGFELTFRLAGDQDAPPSWPFTMLGNVGRYVRAGHPLRVGDHLDLAASITGWPKTDQAPRTELSALLVVPDMTLPLLGTDNGKVRFLQLVGITANERVSVHGDTDVGPLLLALSDRNPMLVTDLSRNER